MTLDTLGNHIDASEFAMHVLGFTPDPQQSRVLESESARVILNCTRQWGKSTVCAAKAVQVAFNEPNGLVLVASPSARQSAEFVRKASAFLRKLGVRPRCPQPFQSAEVDEPTNDRYRVRRTHARSAYAGLRLLELQFRLVRSSPEALVAANVSCRR